MAVIEVHRLPVYKRHYANIFSETGIYCVLQGFLLIFLPLIIAWNSGGGSQFWDTNRFTYSQPKVYYTYTILAEYRGYGGSNNSFTLSSSTSSILASLQGNNVRQTVFQSAQFDNNDDGVIDRFEFGNQLPLSPDERITGASWLIFFQVYLYDQIRYSFDALAVISFDDSVPLSEVNLEGSLTLRQSEQLLSKGGTYTPYLDSPLLPNSYTRMVSAKQVSMSNILNSYGSRNLTMLYTSEVISTNTYPDRPLLNAASNSLNVSITIKIPQQPIRYSPPASELLKNAWIQYLSFFLVVWFLLFHLNTFLFSHNLVRSYALTDAIKDKNN